MKRMLLIMATLVLVISIHAPAFAIETENPLPPLMERGEAVLDWMKGITEEVSDGF